MNIVKHNIIYRLAGCIKIVKWITPERLLIYKSIIFSINQVSKGFHKDRVNFA